MSFEQLKELILLEDFKNCVPENVVVHLNDQKIMTLSEAAVISDEFMLTHKTVFSVNHAMQKLPTTENGGRGDFKRRKVERDRKSVLSRNGEKRACFYCLDPSHMIAECTAWRHDNHAKMKSIALVQSGSTPTGSLLTGAADYTPFILSGTVSLSPDSPPHNVLMLRDTGATQSLILDSQLLFSEESYTGTSVFVRGVGQSGVEVPLHSVCLTSELVSGPVKMGVCSELPVKGISVILGNDLAGGKVFSSLTTVGNHNLCAPGPSATCSSTAVPGDHVIGSQAKKLMDTSELSDSVIPSCDSPECGILTGPRLDTPIVPVVLRVVESPVVAGRDQVAAVQFSEMDLSSVSRLQVLKLALYLLLPALFYLFLVEMYTTGVGAVLLYEHVAGVDHLVDCSIFAPSRPPIGRAPFKMCPEMSLDVSQNQLCDGRWFTLLKTVQEHWCKLISLNLVCSIALVANAIILHQYNLVDL